MPRRTELIAWANLLYCLFCSGPSWENVIGIQDKEGVFSAFLHSFQHLPTLFVHQNTSPCIRHRSSFGNRVVNLLSITTVMLWITINNKERSKAISIYYCLWASRASGLTAALWETIGSSGDLGWARSRDWGVGWLSAGLGQPRLGQWGSSAPSFILTLPRARSPGKARLPRETGESSSL